MLFFQPYKYRVLSSVRKFLVCDLLQFFWCHFSKELNIELKEDYIECYDDGSIKTQVQKLKSKQQMTLCCCDERYCLDNPIPIEVYITDILFEELETQMNQLTEEKQEKMKEIMKNCPGMKLQDFHF